MTKKCFVLVQDGVVVQKQPYEQEGFIEAPFEVVKGWLYDGKKKTFSAPPPYQETDEEILAGIRNQAARRIKASGHDWMAARQITSGIEVPTDIVEYANAVRAASNILEENLTRDYTDESHWPEIIG